MIRKIIQIDENKCNGCGACADACHEGAIAIVNGKAKLIKDDYCDGLGDCLPVCPADAISFVGREAAEYDKETVKNKTTAYVIGQSKEPFNGNKHIPVKSQLRQWPVQIKLVPDNAPYFDNIDLLIAADCTAFAYGSFHSDFIKNRITLIGCPKLDNTDYSYKLTSIFSTHNIKSITVTRMEVPCCGGMEYAVKKAISQSGKNIPLNVITIGIDGIIK